MLGFDPRVARAAWTVFLVAAAIGLAYLAREALFILVLAVFVAYFAMPGVHLLQRYVPRLSRTLAAALVFVVMIGALTAATLSIGQQITEQATALAQKLPPLLDDPRAVDRIPLPKFMESLRARIVAAVREQVGGGGDRAMSLAQRVGAGALRVAGNLLYLVVIPILAFMLVKDAPRKYDALIASFPSGPRRTFWTSLLQDLNGALAKYVRAMLFLSLAAFCAYAVALSLMGVQYALVLAALAGPLEFIPVLGPLMAAGAALLVAAFSGYDHLLWMVVFFLVYRIFQDYVLSPYLMSEGVEVHPVLVIVGILAGEQIGGLPGMFLAIPLLAAGKIIFAKALATPATPAP
jgi:predicted PurR-regulated permease PerM